MVLGKALRCVRFVLLAKFISERKVVKYVVGVFILTFIHKSAILLLPFYLLTYNKLPLDKKYINLAILVFFVVLGATPTWLSIMNNASGMLSFAGYETIRKEFGLWQKTICGKRHGDRIASVILWLGFVSFGFIHRWGHSIKTISICLFVSHCFSSEFTVITHLSTLPISFYGRLNILRYSTCRWLRICFIFWSRGGKRRCFIVSQLLHLHKCCLWCINQ